MTYRTKFMLLLCALLMMAVPALAQRNEGLIDALQDTNGLTAFADLVEELGLADRYNNTDVFYTVFALEDDTVETLLQDLGYESLDEVSETDRLTLSVIVSYHFLPGAYDQATFDAIQAVTDGPIRLASALPGTTITYDDGTIDDVSRVTEADISGNNGFIHIVDNYLVPTRDAFERSVDVITSDAELTEDQAEQATIAGNLLEADEFSMIAEAFETAGVMDDLDEQGPYTVFVMTNDSLNSVMENNDLVWEDILNDDEALSNLLLYHMLSGQYSSTALQEYDETYIGTMLPRTVVGLTVSRNEVSINGLPIVDTDVIASNGIIHVIDGLLLPPSNE